MRRACLISKEKTLRRQLVTSEDFVAILCNRSCLDAVFLRTMKPRITTFRETAWKKHVKGKLLFLADIIKLDAL